MPVYRTVVTISGPSLGGIGTNTWHARASELPGATAELQLVTDQLSAFYNGVQVLMAAGTVFQHDGVFTDISGEDSTLVDTVGWTLNASGTNAPLPPATAMVASWRTPSGGRRGRGRTFLSPLGTNTLQDNGTPMENARLTLSDAGNGVAEFNSEEDNVAIGVWSEADQLLRDITSCTVANEFATLRSRRD